MGTRRPRVVLSLLITPEINLGLIHRVHLAFAPLSYGAGQKSETTRPARLYRGVNSNF